MKSSRPMAAELRNGLAVVGSDGQEVGTVKELRERHFLVNRPLDREVYVQIAAVEEILGHRVVLTVPATEVGSQGWPEPPIAL